MEVRGCGARRKGPREEAEGYLVMGRRGRRRGSRSREGSGRCVGFEEEERQLRVRENLKVST